MRSGTAPHAIRSHCPFKCQCCCGEASAGGRWSRGQVLPVAVGSRGARRDPRRARVRVERTRGLARRACVAWVLAAGVMLASSGVGLLVAVRRPGHPIGWLLLANAFLLATFGVAEAYAAYALQEQPGALPGAGVGGALGSVGLAAAVRGADRDRVRLPRWPPALAEVAARGARRRGGLRGLSRSELLRQRAVRIALRERGQAAARVAGGVRAALAARLPRRARQPRRRAPRPCGCASGAPRGSSGCSSSGWPTPPCWFRRRCSSACGGARDRQRRRRGRLQRALLLHARGHPDVGRRRGSSLPPLRHRPGHQPHARLRRAHPVARRRPMPPPLCCSAPALGSGSAWATAGATLLVAVAFRPLRARVQDVVDRRFSRARYDARTPDRGLPRGPARGTRRARGGRAGAPRGARRSPARAALLAARERALRRRAWPPDGRPAGGRSRANAGHTRRGSRSGWCFTARSTRSGRDCSRRSWRRPGSRSRSCGCVSSCAASSTRSRPRARGSCPPATRSGGGSSATCTTGPSSGWSRSAWRCATHSTSSATRPRRRATSIDGAVTEIDVAIEELRELARGVRPAQLDAGLTPALRELAARAPLPGRGQRERRALSARARGRGLLHRQRGADERRQAFGGPAGHVERGAAERNARRSRSPTTGSAAPRPTGRLGAARAGRPGRGPRRHASRSRASRTAAPSSPRSCRASSDRGGPGAPAGGLGAAVRGRRARGGRVARRRRAPARRRSPGTGPISWSSTCACRPRSRTRARAPRSRSRRSTRSSGCSSSPSTSRPRTRSSS